MEFDFPFDFAKIANNQFPKRQVNVNFNGFHVIMWRQVVRNRIQENAILIVEGVQMQSNKLKTNIVCSEHYQHSRCKEFTTNKTLILDGTWTEIYIQNGRYVNTMGTTEDFFSKEIAENNPIFALWFQPPHTRLRPWVPILGDAKKDTSLFGQIK